MAGKRIVIPNYMPALDLTGAPVSGARLYFYQNNTTTLATVYTSAALTTAHPNPVISNAAGVFPSIFADEAAQFTVALTDSTGKPISGLRNYDNVAPALVYGADATAAENAAAAAAASLAEVQAIEAAGSTAPSIAGKADKSVVGVNMASLGTIDDPLVDNTSAFNAARASLPDVQFPLGDWYGNFAITESAQGIRGRIGEGETGAGGVNALRPFDITLPTVTVGGGASPVFNATIRDVLISGHKATGQEAPAALRLTAGVSHFFASNIELIGGLRTLDCLPDNDQPVTCSGIDHFHIRCDVAGSDARAIRFTRTGSDGEYFTGFSMHQGHVNGPSGTGSYALEIDGSVSGITASFVDVYFDCKPGKGVLVRGSSLLLGFNCQLDPGTNNVVVVKTDQTSRDPADSLSGNIRTGQQYIENVLGQQTLIPGDVEWFFRFMCASNSYLGGQTFLNNDPSDRFSQSVYLTGVSAGGPIGLYGAPFRAMDATQATSLTAAALQTNGGLSVAKDIRVGGTWYHYGSGGAVNMTSEPNGVGWRWDVTNAGGNLRFTPGSGGFTIFGAGGVIPLGDNAQSNGAVGNAWSNLVTTKVSDAAGNQVLGSRVTGFGAMTGTAVKTAIATYTAPTVEATYTQATVQALADAVQALSRRLKAMDDALFAHGQIGA